MWSVGKVETVVMKKAVVGLVLVLAVVSLSACAAILLYRLWTPAFSDLGDSPWKYRFLVEHARTDDSGMRFHVPHPTRGWVPKPNLAMDGPARLTTNSRGVRSGVEYVRDPSRYTVLVAGDSFTFGVDCGDTDTWPAILQVMEPRLQVINMAVCGYGIDQMYVTVKETVEEYMPQLVILAFIEEDFYRSMLTFRDYRKPKFELGDDGRLVLTNTPIGDEADTYAALHKEYGWLCPKWRLWREDQAYRARLGTREFQSHLEALNWRIIDETQREAAARGAEFLIVRLTTGLALNPQRRPESPNPDWQLQEDFAKGHAVESLDTRRAFLEAGSESSVRHYQRPEAELVSGLIRTKIQTLRSWREYLARQ